ncbi:esterase [Frondihabitans sucicola]|uniref:Esterase n=1 Tax=Frondihabitans sucicola TaxID=1268041 RepID=A0ABN6Y4L5_9MICO|nr:alpha/beta hydrolase-fold protein [Frondihabitans sucicola]BDZ50915.1 esterase [Frondihabitans sucicola]
MNPEEWLEHLSLVATPTLGVSYAIAGLFAILLLTRPRKRRGPWARHVVVAVVLGAAIGGTAIWVVGDLLNEFDVPPTWVDRVWVGALVAGVCLGVVNLVFAPVGRKVVAVFAIAGFVLAGGLAINRDVGEFVTLGQAAGVDLDGPLVLPTPASSAFVEHDSDIYADWKPPALMPRHGRVGSVSIPATTSHFVARRALVYLPPAALVASAPALPVVILMSGQPGSPSSVMAAGRIPRTLDALAKKNHGLAPIVVVPDQLGSAGANPMCVDGALGNSARYLTVDVPAWIRAHLHVVQGREAWAAGGFSQGATCALQFATGDPALFGSFLDVSGQRYPTLSSDRTAIEEGFAGSSAAFDRAKPAAVMQRHGPYADTVGFFAAGENDATYRRNMTVMSTLAARSKITVTRYLSPDSGHDWTTASNAFARGLAGLYPRLGLSTMGRTP